MASRTCKKRWHELCAQAFLPIQMLRHLFSYLTNATNKQSPHWVVISLILLLEHRGTMGKSAVPSKVSIKYYRWQCST